MFQKLKDQKFKENLHSFNEKLVIVLGIFDLLVLINLGGSKNLRFFEKKREFLSTR